MSGPRLSSPFDPCTIRTAGTLPCALRGIMSRPATVSGLSGWSVLKLTYNARTQAGGSAASTSKPGAASTIMSAIKRCNFRTSLSFLLAAQRYAAEPLS
jgi:hypothetical protein